MLGDRGGSVRGIEKDGPRQLYGAVCAWGLIATALTAAAVLCGIVLRWHGLGAQSLWYDEGYTAWAVGLSSADIIRFARSDTSPPLYLLLQHYWGTLFGNSEYALRSLSALFGTLSLPVFYFLAKKVLRDGMAVALAMWLFAFSMMQLWYSQEARFYALVSFLALVSLYALVLFLEKRSVALFGTIVLSVAASLYTHNMMFFYLLALNVTWLVYPSERAWKERLREALVADVLAGVLYLPWLPSLLRQVLIVHESFWAPRPTVLTLFHTLTIVAGFYLDYLAAVAGRLFPLSSHTVWLCVLGGVSFLCAVIVAGGLWGVSKADRNRNVSLLLYCLLPILAVFELSRVTNSVYLDRIFMDSSAILPIVFAYPLAVQRERKRRIFFGFWGIALGITTALSGFGYLRYQEKEDWRGASMSLLRIPESNRLIVFAPRTGEILFDYYAQQFPDRAPSVARIGLPRSFFEQFPPSRIRGPLTDPRDISPLKLALESRKYCEVDLVLAHGFDSHGLVLGYLNQFFARREEERFNEVTVVRFLAPSIDPCLGSRSFQRLY